MLCVHCGAELSVSEPQASCTRCGSPPTIPPASESSHSSEPSVEPVPQEQQIQHRVVFISREGREVEGNKWLEFINHQQEIMDQFGARGWHLVAVTPVTWIWPRGVFLYFSSPGAQG